MCDAGEGGSGGGRCSAPIAAYERQEIYDRFHRKLSHILAFVLPLATTSMCRFYVLFS
jgi:hypothetical protein